MTGFVKAMRTEEADFLDKYPIANHVLNVIARRARRTPCKMSGLEVGECFIGHKGLGITEQQYRTAKKQLGSWGLVEFKRGKRATDVGTVAKLLNSKVYDINETEGNGRTTEEQRKNNGKVTTNKECKKERKKEDSNAVAQSLLSFLNEVSGKSFKVTTKPNIAMVNGLLSDGYSEDDIKLVCRFKNWQWKNDENMREYIRPATLFAKKNFDGYLQAAKDEQARHCGTSKPVVEESEHDKAQRQLEAEAQMRRDLGLE